MYYSGACLDYGYHFQYSSKEHNAGIAATIGADGAGGKNGNGASRLARAALIRRTRTSSWRARPSRRKVCARSLLMHSY